MRPSLSDAFERAAAAERAFASSEFIVPVVRGRKIRVRIAGVVLSMAIEPSGFEGWGVFKVKDHGHAVFVRHPKMSERESYLKLYPRHRLVLTAKRNDQWFGISAGSDRRLLVTGDVPIRLLEGVQLFDTVITRFDGDGFWFESRDRTRSQVADRLRAALTESPPIEILAIDGITPVERLIYEAARSARLSEIAEESRDKTEDRIRSALMHAGAVLQGYRDVGDSYTVEYMVDGNKHTSIVRHDLSVHSAGICLSGGDSAFDLTSLVSVIRDGVNRRRIVRVGLNAVGQDGFDDHDDDY